MAIHSEAESLTLESAILGSPIPVHDGAIRHYREQQVWWDSGAVGVGNELAENRDPILQTVLPIGRPDGFDAETPTRLRGGAPGWLVSGLAVGLSFYALYWVVAIVQPQVYHVSFLLIALVLTFLLYPARRARREGVTLLDWLFAALAVAALAWPIVDFNQFVYRAATPTTTDLALGTVATLLLLEATRRTVGWILPVTAVAFLAYAYYGPLLELVGLGLFAHRGYDLARLVGTLYMTLEGIFGVPLDVAATYIILFTIFGAVLHHSGAGQFFITWTMAAIGKSGSGAGPGRTVAMSGFLLGMVSGSGVATTVTLGAVAWPLLRRAGYTPEAGGGILSASGIGAILAPADDGRRGVSHRGVPQHFLPAGGHDGDRASGALLLVDRPDDRGGLQADGRQGDRRRHSPALVPHETVRVPVLASLHGGDPPGVRHDGVPCGVLGDAAGHRSELPSAATRALAETTLSGTGVGRP